MAWKNKLKARSLEDEYRLADDVWQEQESKLSDNDSYEVQKNNNTYASTSDTSLYLRIGNIKKTVANTYIESAENWPIAADYKIGWFIRYFAKRIDGAVIETDKFGWEDVQKHKEDSPGLYKISTLKWHLKPIISLEEYKTTSSSIINKLKSIEVGVLNQDVAKINERYTIMTDESKMPGLLDTIG